MDQIGWQVILRCRDDRVFAPPGIARLLYLDAVLRHGKDHAVYTHGLGDTHGHLGTTGTRDQAGELGRRMVLTLARTLPGSLQFEPCRIRPINDQQHLYRLVGYHIQQAAHHGVCSDPLREATAAFDYLGLRPAGAYLRKRLGEKLPRITDHEILRYLPVKPASKVELSHLGEAMRSAAASAATSNTRADRAARCAAVHAAAGEPLRAIAAALGLGIRCVQQLHKREPDQALVLAIREQMGLRAAFLAKAVRPVMLAANERYDSFDDFLMNNLDM